MLLRAELDLVPFQNVKRCRLHCSSNLTEDKTIITYDRALSQSFGF
jgi:hypothetical protein